jgi:hypothetical protein
MKVLYVGVYRDPTGWGRAATDYIWPWTPRASTWSPARSSSTPPGQAARPGAGAGGPARARLRRRRPARPAHQMDYNGRLLNVACTPPRRPTSRRPGPTESTRWTAPWSSTGRWSTPPGPSGVTVPLGRPARDRRLPVPAVVRAPRPAEAHKDRGDFLFYTVGEWVKRKNLGALLKAFHLEFDPFGAGPAGHQDVVSPGSRRRTAGRAVENFCEEVKRGSSCTAGPEDYKQEVVITERLTDQG